MALTLQLLDQCQLVLGHHLGVDFVHTQLGGDVFGDPLGITGCHDHFDTPGVQGLDRGWGVVADRIGNGDDAHGAPVDSHEHGRLAGRVKG